MKLSDIPLYSGHIGTVWDRPKCPDQRGVLISEVGLDASLCSWDRKHSPFTELYSIVHSKLYCRAGPLCADTPMY